MLSASESRRSHPLVPRGTSGAGQMGRGTTRPASIGSARPDYLQSCPGAVEQRYCTYPEHFATYGATLAATLSGASAAGARKGCASSGAYSPDRKVQAVIHATLHTTPLDATHWSARSMAQAQGLSKDTIHRIWKQHHLKPHLIETFKLSRDKRFVEKLHDVVGLYLNPPDKALVLCVDEKSQIQALDRTQPLLPLRPGVPARQTHDYKRNGTTNLFAALNMLDGTVIGDCMPRHRHQEFIRFLQLISVKTALDLDLHLIVDNYGTHKHPRVQSWLKRHPRFHLHFIPTSSSWLNMVERWFREITDRRIRRGSFQNVPDLIAAINQYIQTHNQNPKVFV